MLVIRGYDDSAEPKVLGSSPSILHATSSGIILLFHRIRTAFLSVLLLVSLIAAYWPRSQGVKNNN
jgi:hypothetical protein